MRRRGAGEEVVEQADGVVPFERDAFEGKPGVVSRDMRGDEEGGEEGEKSREQEGQVRETGIVDLGGFHLFSRAVQTL